MHLLMQHACEGQTAVWVRQTLRHCIRRQGMSSTACATSWAACLGTLPSTSSGAGLLAKARHDTWMLLPKHAMASSPDRCTW